MSVIISVANQKGGTAKTTTSTNLSLGLAMRGFKTLLIDLDPQGNSTTAIGKDKKSFVNTIYNSLVKEEPIENIIIKTDFENLDLCPANRILVNAETELLTKIGREHILKKELNKLQDRYDYIIIDCPPSLGVLSTNALTASDSVIITIEASEFSLDGMGEFMTTFQLVKYINNNLTVEGVLVTRAESNTNTFKNCHAQLKQLFGDKCYNFYIPRNQALSDSQSSINFDDGKPKPCIYSKPKEKGSIEYNKLVDEVIRNVR